MCYNTVHHEEIDCCADRPHGPLGGPAWHHKCYNSDWRAEGVIKSGACTTTTTTASDGTTTTYYNGEETTTVSASEEVSTSTGSNSNGQAATKSAMSYWPLVVAAVAATTALLAVVVGQRRDHAGNHQLKGSVARRMDLFSNFADRALCDTSTRPDRVIEMTNSTDDYRLA